MALEKRHFDVVRRIGERLEGARIRWAITGSLGLALQGVEFEVHDVDIQTDRAGAYEIERLFAEYVTRPIWFSRSERIQSHFGVLEMDGIKVEIMGDIQKRREDGTWEDPVALAQYERWVDIGGTRLPVLSLEYEYEAYLKLGRIEKAETIRKWLEQTGARSSARTQYSTSSAPASG